MSGVADRNGIATERDVGGDGRRLAKQGTTGGSVELEEQIAGAECTADTSTCNLTACTAQYSM